MSYAASILPEFEQEMANTRKVLNQVPDALFNWKAHERSNTIGWNANHLAEIVGWVEGTFARPKWDIAGYESPKLTSTTDVLALFDQNLASACTAIQNVQESSLTEIWSLTNGDQTLMSMPRSAVIRTFVLSHTIHHRAHLCVYLRLNDIPVPGMYGPSGDEGLFA
ncbi:DinB superfamily protein [Rosistilla ulvae]|uniref:DinB superfamily protein n=1 Tax=Rosistilla ulvae TaxID=1930277 RepID=A0A517M721_9BACT|nr:DinB family protein [Rosistilla ulvae]QDS90587.1 DinB superfamily protein [Rosistilla ulvae]